MKKYTRDLCRCLGGPSCGVFPALISFKCSTITEQIPSTKPQLPVRQNTIAISSAFQQTLYLTVDVLTTGDEDVLGSNGTMFNAMFI